MNETNAVIVAEAQPMQAVTPMTMLQMAVAQGADLDRLQKLMDLQERWEANEARKAYVAAMNQFKASPPTIIKNKTVSFETTKGNTTYKHATLDSVTDIIGAALSAVDISHRWDVEQLEGGIVRVTCVLTHKMGHSERVSMAAGLDQSGGKNNIQALGSVISYLQRYTLKAATGMAEANADDDGHGGDGDDIRKPEPDAAGKAILEKCGSLTALQDAWKALTPEQRKTLNGIKDECKARILDADKKAAA